MSNQAALKRLKSESKKPSHAKPPPPDQERNNLLKLIAKTMSAPDIPLGTLRKIHDFALHESAIARELVANKVPFCDCGEAMIRPRQVRDETKQNYGKWFYACPRDPKIHPFKCDVFRWATKDQVDRFVNLQGSEPQEEQQPQENEEGEGMFPFIQESEENQENQE